MKKCEYASPSATGSITFCNWYCKNMVTEDNDLFLYFPPCAQDEDGCPIKNIKVILKTMLMHKGSKMKSKD